MLAARVLSDHFDNVTVLERDRFPEAPDARKGLPQGRHAHALLEGGLGALERLLPGLSVSWCGPARHHWTLPGRSPG
jgi:hypothetical protein